MPIETRILLKDDLPRFFEALKKWGDIISPKRVKDGALILDRVGSLDEVDWSCESPINSPKSFLFPQVDPVFRYWREDGRFRVEPVFEPARLVFFAIHSCDVKGIQYQDKIFSLELPDEHYLRRRRESLLVSVTCQHPTEYCFCICARCGPFLDDGYDLQLTDLDDRFLVEVGTPKGLEVVNENSALFKAATEGDIEERNRREEEARNRFHETRAFFAGAMTRLALGPLSEETLRKVADLCIECGGCTMACPTCHCFNIVDVGTLDEGERTMVWDACKYEGYTREASGFNPRPFLWRRVWNRYFDKVGLERFKTYGMLGCVGCGRCVMVCPGMADMPFAVKAIRRGVVEPVPTGVKEISAPWYFRPYGAKEEMMK